MNKTVPSTSVKMTNVRHDKLKRIICEEYRVNWQAIASKSRLHELVEARRCYYAILRNVFFYKLLDIGKETNQDHSTVIASLKAHERYTSVYRSERTRYNNVKTIMLEGETKEELEERIESLNKEKIEIENQIEVLFIKANRIEKELIINNK